jgi:hypothetical protein
LRRLHKSRGLRAFQRENIMNNQPASRRLMD